MKEVKIVIERSKDHYSSYAVNVEGIYAGGDTPLEAKENALQAIKLLKENNSQKNIPAILKEDYTVVFVFDVQSLLQYYKGIFTDAALERITGINQRQINHYSTGLKKPRPQQRKKIESGLRALADELMNVEL